jgi:hypothetical protein
MPRQLTNLRIDEVSSVDRGAGKGVRVLLLKRDFSSDERQAAANSGAALPDGSFPIKNGEDLKNAIHLVGNAKDPAKAKAHIKARAASLGLSGQLPGGWSKRETEVTNKALQLAIGSILSDGGDADDLVKCFNEFHDFLERENDMSISVNKDDLTKLIGDTVAKALKDAGVVAKMTPEHEAYHAQLDGDEASKFAAMSHDERTQYAGKHPHEDGGDEEDKDVEEEGDEEPKAGAKKILEKIFGADVAKAMLAVAKAKKKKRVEGLGEDDEDDGDQEPRKNKTEKRLDAVSKAIKDENETLKKRLSSLENDKAEVTYAKRAVEIGLSEKDGAVLLKAHRGDPEALVEMEKRIQALNTQVVKAGMFSEIGSSGGGAATAHDELVAKAAEIRKADTTGKMTVEQAYDKAMTAYPEIAKREKAERDNRIFKMA